MSRLRALALAWLLAPWVASAQTAPWQAEAGVGRESLTRGLSDWQQTDLALRRRWAPRSLIELNARRTERFDQHDSEWGLALALPLGDAWDATLALTASPTHRVLPRSSLAAGLQRQLGAGWVLGAGLRTTRYASDRTHALTLGVERYFGSAALGEWRAAASATATRLSGAGTDGSGRLQLDRYFGDRHRVGLLVAAGREVESVGGGQLLASDVRSVVLLGRWSLAPAWALTGEFGQTRVDDRYRRTGGRLGVQLDF